MANKEHLQILKQEIKAWNQWRMINFNTIPNLSGADLSGANLYAAELQAADLNNADLSGANLSSAKLGDAKLYNTNLRGANLSNAILSGANLTTANLSGANLSRAVLVNTNLSGADLSGADLNGSSLASAILALSNLEETSFANATLSQTIFSFTSLKTARGLASCRHYAPSSVDLATLQASGQLPDAFLRGIGATDEFISYLPSFWNQPIQFYSCFISYSTKDDAFAQCLFADLQAKGVRCWFAPEDLKIGDRFRVKIDEAIWLHEKLLLVLSEYSVQSDWVQTEVETALERERREKCSVLFPVRVDDAVMDTNSAWAGGIRRTRQIGDFRDWKNHDAYTKAFDRLLRDLKSIH